MFGDSVGIGLLGLAEIPPGPLPKGMYPANPPLGGVADDVSLSVAALADFGASNAMIATTAAIPMRII